MQVKLPLFISLPPDQKSFLSEILSDRFTWNLKTCRELHCESSSKNLSQDDLYKRNIQFFFMFMYNHILLLVQFSFVRHACVLCPIGGHLGPIIISNNNWSSFVRNGFLCARSFFCAVLNRNWCCYGNDYLLNNDLSLHRTFVVYFRWNRNTWATIPKRACVTIENREIWIRYFVDDSHLKYMKFTYLKKLKKCVNVMLLHDNNWFAIETQMNQFSSSSSTGNIKLRAVLIIKMYF